jgi:hypothetical protein
MRIVQLAAEECPLSMFPFNKLLQINVLRFYPYFALKCELVTSFCTGFVLRIKTRLFKVMWPQNTLLLNAPMGNLCFRLGG